MKYLVRVVSKQTIYSQAYLDIEAETKEEAENIGYELAELSGEDVEWESFDSDDFTVLSSNSVATLEMDSVVDSIVNPETNM